VYELEGRRQSGPALPRIKEIVRVDTPPQPPRTPKPNPRKRKIPALEEDDDDSDAGEVYATIKAYGDDSEIADYKIAVAKSGIETKAIQGNKVRLAKIFQDGSYMASGILDILVGGEKSIKPTKHSFMSFVVLWGKVEAKVHRTVFVIGRGGVFVVPRGTFPPAPPPAQKKKKKKKTHIAQIITPFLT
jgi:centromere protein C